ncbi:MAG: TIGR00282 family metallophosphoesterase [Rectinemataceae bacterium]|nr:TIGR00282 family metallophosphoesterase [Rectinemataceae bacterium]
MQKTVRVLLVGDIIGTPGMRALFTGLKALARKHQADLVVANGENAQGGFGITKEDTEKMFASGVDVITSGNHVWERPLAAELLDSEPRLLRPANYPAGAPGSGSLYLKTASGAEWLVINAQGREGMYPIDCPFKTCSDIVKRAKREHPRALVVVDFHAESPEEKEALAWHLDGEISVLAGTHTHVQTADERILPKGTGYLTDLGMTGPADSVIGVKQEICLQRSLTQIPIKMETAEGEADIRGAVFELDASTGKCVGIARI